MQLTEMDPRSNGNSRSARIVARIFSAKPVIAAPWKNESRAAESLTAARLTTLAYSLAKPQRLANFGFLVSLRRLKNSLRFRDHDVDRLWRPGLSGPDSFSGSISCGNGGSSRLIPAF
jgi:hypothetical protein